MPQNTTKQLKRMRLNVCPNKDTSQRHSNNKKPY